MFGGDRAKLTRLEAELERQSQTHRGYVDRANRESEELQRRTLVLESALRQKDEEHKALVEQVQAACQAQVAKVISDAQSEFDRKQAEIQATN